MRFTVVAMLVSALAATVTAAPNPAPAPASYAVAARDPAVVAAIEDANILDARSGCGGLDCLAFAAITGCIKLAFKEEGLVWAAALACGIGAFQASCPCFTCIDGLYHLAQEAHFCT